MVEVENITKGVKKMKMATPQKKSTAMASPVFSLDVVFPFFKYICVGGNRQKITIDFQVILSSQSNYQVEVINDGKAISLTTTINPLFTQEDRLHMAKYTNRAFNENTSEAASFRKVTAEINIERISLQGKPQIVTLDFKCDEYSLEWDCNSFLSDEDDELAHALGTEGVHYTILSVQLFSCIQISKIKKKGNMTVFKRSSKKVKAKREGMNSIYSPDTNRVDDSRKRDYVDPNNMVEDGEDSDER